MKPFQFISAALVAAVAVAASPAAVAQAQPYPNKPVKVVIPTGPGGGTDFLGRLIGKRLQERLGQPFIMEYKPGATGNIGSEYAARSTPDGYTLLVGYQGTHAINPTLYRKMTYDTVDDFETITQIVSMPFVFVVNPSLPVTTMKEFVAYAKANPGKLNYGSAGAGSGGHAVSEWFNLENGLKTTHIPYTGSALVAKDLIAGHIQYSFDTINTMGPQIKGGTLRGIAVTGAERSSAIPEVPTTAEAGYPEFTPRGWWGVFAPKGTPKDIVAKLHKEIVEIVQEPEIREQLIKAGYTPTTSPSPEAFRTFAKSEIDAWGKVIKATGARAD